MIDMFTGEMSMVMRRLAIILVALFVSAAAVQAQPPATESGNSSGAPAAQDDDPDMDPNRAQPDFTLLTLPTTLRLPRHKMAFRVTHRFGRPLGQGDFGDLAADLFGLDSGAQIGMEFRYGLVRGGQIGIYRTSNRTIQFFGQYELLSQRGNAPVSLDIVANVDGTNN